jgi:hypothetical protein
MKILALLFVLAVSSPSLAQQRTLIVCESEKLLITVVDAPDSQYAGYIFEKDIVLKPLETKKLIKMTARGENLVFVDENFSLGIEVNSNLPTRTYMGLMRGIVAGKIVDEKVVCNF